MTTTVPRPKQHLIAAGKLYAGAWRAVNYYRQGRGNTYPAWPPWCFLPIAAGAGIVAQDAGVSVTELPQRYPARILDAARLTALATWRVTQSIYRFDSTLYDHLVATPITGDLPCEIVRHLPEWCVYIETPGRRWDSTALHGFFAHMECDPNGREELRLLIDAETALLPIPLHLGPWSLDESLARMIDVGRVHAAAYGLQQPSTPANLREEIEPLLSLLLYLCVDVAEIGDGTRAPANPRPVRTKRGWRMFPAEHTTEWDIGVRIGAALRHAYRTQEMQQTPGDAHHASQRAHIRRAHWHTFLAGVDRVERRLKWLPPIPINVDDVDALPVTTKMVEGKP